MYKKNSIPPGGRLLLLSTFLHWYYVACMPMDSGITMNGCGALKMSKEQLPPIRTDISLPNKELVQDHLAGDGEPIAQNVQQLADEWKKELEAGLQEISTSRREVTQKIEDKKLFDTIPRYLDVLIGNQLEVLTELKTLPKSDETIMGGFLIDWLKNPERFLEQEEALKLESPAANQLSSFLGAHTPEELAHFELQFRKMIHNSNKRLWRMITKLDEDGLNKLAENSQVGKDLGKSTDGFQTPKSRANDPNGGVEQNGHSGERIKFTKERELLKVEENRLHTTIVDGLKDKTNPIEAEGIYSLINRISNFHIRHQIKYVTEQQEALDELLNDLLRLKETPAPPRVLYAMLKELVQSLHRIIKKEIPQEALIKTDINPLKLSTLWNAQSSADLRRFGVDAQLFQNMIHRHLLELFKEHGHWHSSHSRSLQFWIDSSRSILDSEDFEKASSKFDDQFIDQLRKAETDFGNGAPVI